MVIAEKNKLLLSVETATRAGSLALFSGETVCGEWTGSETFSHSGELLIEIEKLLHQSKVKIKNVQSFAVALGPGSFTGLRVGLATVKGLSAALKTPTIGVPTLSALCESVETSGDVCAILPAGRKDFFFQTFQRDERKQIFAQTEIKSDSLSNILDKLNFDTTFNLVAPLDAHDEINLYLSGAQPTSQRVLKPPDNLAIYVGRIALKSKVFSTADQLTLIYGREAGVGGNKR